MTNWRYKTYRAVWGALDLLFPPDCAGCGKKGTRWCGDCRSRTIVLNGLLCEVCGLPQKRSGLCEACANERPPFRSLRAWTVFGEPVRSALHRLKYYKDQSLGDMLAAEMLPFTRELGWKIDMMTPVPLGKQRKRKRGYNQVAMIAIPLSLGMEWKYAPRALMRRKETRSQVGLTYEERRANMHCAFEAKRWVSGKSVLVMDDVSTTGSTLSAATEALYQSGARDVYALTVARALPHHDLAAA